MNDITKICKSCGQPKPLNDFKKELRCKEGITPHCKSCLNDRKKKYRQDNHSHYLAVEKKQRQNPLVKLRMKEWWEMHRGEQSEKARIRYETNPTPYLRRSKEQRGRDPIGYREYLKKWNKENPHWARNYYHNVLKKDINWRIRNTLRGSLRKALNGSNKTCSVLQYLGCSLEFFRGYMESKFNQQMSWDNYGLVWHIDHVLPCKSFDMTKEDERKKCFHYSNLQPLTIADNCSKQDKLPDGNMARTVLTTLRKSV